MLKDIDLKKILFLDVETVPQSPGFHDLQDNWKALWEKKIRFQTNDEITAGELYERAGIYAEFGKIVCISFGAFENDAARAFRMKSYFGDNESEILTAFSEMLRKLSNDFLLCAHNGKEFDFPFIARRCLINGLPIPAQLDNAGKKPWEVKHLDTMELWKFGDYKSYTSLELLAAVFDLPSPKDKMDGSDVWKVYWLEKNVSKIRDYCQKDVATLASLMLKFVRPGASCEFTVNEID